MLQKILMLWIAALVFVLSSCTSVTRQGGNTTHMGVSQEDNLGGTGTSSADIRSMAERMALEISNIAWPPAAKEIRIAFESGAITNDSGFFFNPEIIRNRLLTDLVRMSQGTRIQYTQDRSEAEYNLTCEITSLSKGSSEGRVDYLLYTFKLVDKRNFVKWIESYETKKQGKVGVMYR